MHVWKRTIRMSRRNNGQISGLYGGDARGLYGSQSYGRRNTMIYGKQPPRWPKFLIIIVIIALVVLCVLQVACGIPFGKEEAEEPTEQTTKTTQTTQVAEPEGPDATITITAIGDCTLGTDTNLSTDTNFNTVYENNGSDPTYNFRNVVGYTSADDLTIINFEGTLSESTDRQDKEYAFEAPFSYVDILTNGSVEAANLANNHSYDYGTQSYEDTKQTLTDAGIVNFGYDRVNTTEINGVKIGFLGLNAVSEYGTATDQLYTDVAALEEEGCTIIICCIHAGTEGAAVPDSEQVTLAHAAVDAGCDLVLGTHPHVLQGVELYNNCYILYSLGNFVFGGNDSPGEFSTMMWQQTFTVKNGELVVDADTLATACVIPCRLSTSSSELNDYQPVALSGEEATSVMTLLNDRSAQLPSGGVVFGTEVDETNRAYLNS